MSEDASPSSPVEPKVRRGPDHQVVFANHSRVRITPTEISLSFGFLDEIPGEPPSVQEKVTIVLTPAHTKSLIVSLNAILNIFEAKYGNIKVQYPEEQLPLDSVREALAKL